MEAGINKISVTACVEEKKVLDLPCGKPKSKIYNQVNNPNTEEGKILKGMFLVQREIGSTAFEIREEFADYKASQPEAVSEEDRIFDQYVDNYLNVNTHIIAEFLTSDLYDQAKIDFENKVVEKNQQTDQLGLVDDNDRARHRAAGMAKGIFLMAAGALLVPAFIAIGYDSAPKVASAVKAYAGPGKQSWGSRITPDFVKTTFIRSVGAVVGVVAAGALMLYGYLYFQSNLLFLAENPRQMLLRKLDVYAEKIDALKQENKKYQEALQTNEEQQP